ncbi:hypothetical protein L6164_036598 [Bauhinia variegata]|uniref:Uncharacterized protein n=1 Tax=Bauhinia variegata TaxID=167791 RepID=A0ACB9KHJ6_BAUVA|nr:hypothetical protein L6164_036598 [Bauhinia variegata]
MGCCVSANKASDSASSTRKDQNLQPPRSSISRVEAAESRAPPLVEEETVKEVLSETPKWSPYPPIAELEAEKPTQKPGLDKFEEKSKIEESFPINKVEEISEVSEVCSLSESISTTTITDRRDEDDEVLQRVNGSPAKIRKNRTFSGDFAGKRGRVVGKSPSRRSEQSPGRKNAGPARLVQNKDQLGEGIGNRGMRNEFHRRDPREKSDRRSMSPATRTDNAATRSVVGRSPSARRTNRSPARVRTAPPESGGQKLEQSNMEEKWPSANETLENPLVSLECFIFL